MKCPVCRFGDMDKGFAQVVLNRGNATVIFRNVPAMVCCDCGEYYLDEQTADEISKMLSESYPYQSEAGLHSRFSVTELAHMDEPPEENDEITLKKPVFLSMKTMLLR